MAYHPLELLSRYGVPFEKCFEGGISPRRIRAGLGQPAALKVPPSFDPAFDPQRKDLLSRIVGRWGHFEGALTNGDLPALLRFCWLGRQAHGAAAEAGKRGID